MSKKQEMQSELKMHGDKILEMNSRGLGPTRILWVLSLDYDTRLTYTYIKNFLYQHLSKRSQA